jgi:putative ATP-dependent endonuclease of OLD family
MDGRARELLKVVYLKPLRDAEREMSSGRNSRISQILLGHPVFSKQDNHKLIDILKDANQNVEKYFSEEDGKIILSTIKTTLDAFNESNSTSDARFETSDYQLKAILESLSLTVPEIRPGLGETNLLFMAAELLLLRHDDNGGLKLALIEELEAHLHPQAQLRLISYLQNEYNESGAQIIVSTHSTILASKINLKNIVLLKNNVGYDLSYGKTGLEKGDYLFLQRFLDTSKANLFFAKGVIMVEGDAENILIPTLAEIIGLPLEKHGVSVVNVGSTAFLRYSRILTRADHSSVDIPVSIITDCDVHPEYKDDGSFDKKDNEALAEVAHKEQYYSIDTIKGFIAPRWTLEYCLALSCLATDIHKAIHYAKKIKNSDKYSLTVSKIQAENVFVETEQSEWNQLTNDERAYKIFRLMLDENNKSGLKAIVAQCLASMLKWKYVEKPTDLTEDNMFDLDLYQYRIIETERAKLQESIENDPYINYLVKAIRYAVGVQE